MAQDTLHFISQIQHLNSDLINIVQNNNSEIVKAIEQLKNDLKPEPKSHLEKFGYIYAAGLGAFLAIIGGIVTFKLNEWKDIKIRKEDNEKEELIRQEENGKADKAIRHKIFADVKEVTQDFIDAVKQRDIALLNIYYQRGIISLTFNEEDAYLKNIDVGLDEIDFIGLNRNLEEKRKIYSERLSNYIFHKEAETEVININSRMLRVGMNYKVEKFEGLENKQKMDEFKKFQEVQINNALADEVSMPTSLILTYIMQNK